MARVSWPGISGGPCTTPGVVQGPPLVPGQDTRAILQELGYDDARIDALAEAKAILDWRP